MLRIRRRYVILSVLLLVLVAAAWLLSGVTINFPAQRPIDRLTEARTVWEAQNQTNYDMWIALHSFSMIGAFKISVRDNQVTNVENGYFQSCDNCTLTPIDARTTEDYQAAFGRFYPPTFNDLTMDKLFAFAADKFKDEPAPPVIAMCSPDDTSRWRYEATYDQTTGHITTLRYTICPRYTGVGLMCPAVSDCNTEIVVTSLKPSEE